MNIHGVRSIMKVLGSSIVAEEIGSIKIEAAMNTSVEFFRRHFSADYLQSVEVVTCVKVIDPMR
jgi:hypothetical protein